ncbi:hypothetical protein FKM82_008181 [Ascaphus truei]
MAHRDRRNRAMMQRMRSAAQRMKKRGQGRRTHRKRRVGRGPVEYHYYYRQMG